MHALSATELLSVWESGSSQIPLRRALAMIAAACPEVSSDSLASLTIGQRDARLLALREAMFGAELTGITDCPECGEKIELTFNCSDIRQHGEIEPAAELAVQSNGREVRFRLPTSADLLAVNSSEQLLERCKKKHGIKIYHFVNVGNHLHLLVKPEARRYEEAKRDFQRFLSTNGHVGDELASGETVDTAGREASPR